jgi:hypothetical protein
MFYLLKHDNKKADTASEWQKIFIHNLLLEQALQFFLDND